MTSLHDATVLVTGADGFTGSHLVDYLLERDAKVSALVRTMPLRNLRRKDRLEIIIGDMLDYTSLMRSTRGIDFVVHTAGVVAIDETEAMKRQTLETNVVGMLNLLQASSENEVKRLLYTSTCHVYGRQEKLPITEQHVPSPIGLYAVSKKAAEDVCRTFADDLDTVIARSFNKYGERQEPSYLIPRIITKALQDGKVELGNPKPTRDYIYIGDAVDGYVSMLLKGRRGEVYHLSSRVERSVEDVANKILREILRVDVVPTWNYDMRKRIDIPRLVGDSSKARREFGWEPRVDFDSGLRRTVEWYKRSLTTH